tara:strand:+ start:707 stop:1033 length:327 start_codon:yes stop_codon:yes gene_type:complete
MNKSNPLSIYDVINDYFKKGKIKTFSIDPVIGFSSLTYQGKDGFVLPSKEDLEKEIPVLQASIDAQAYARSRAKSYDPIPEQLDQIYHDIDGWKAKIKAVKDKYPKPT